MPHYVSQILRTTTVDFCDTSYWTSSIPENQCDALQASFRQAVRRQLIMIGSEGLQNLSFANSHPKFPYSGSLARIPSSILGSAQASHITRGDPWLPVDTRGEWSNMSRMIN